MKTSSAIKVLDGKTRAVYKDEFPGVGLVQKHIYIYIQLCIQCALPVVTIMALWQLLNLDTGCTVTHC